MMQVVYQKNMVCISCYKWMGIEEAMSCFILLFSVLIPLFLGTIFPVNWLRMEFIHLKEICWFVCCFVRKQASSYSIFQLFRRKGEVEEREFYC